MPLNEHTRLKLLANESLSLSYFFYLILWQLVCKMPLLWARKHFVQTISVVLFNNTRSKLLKSYLLIFSKRLYTCRKKAVKTRHPKVLLVEPRSCSHKPDHKLIKCDAVTHYIQFHFHTFKFSQAK